MKETWVKMVKKRITHIEDNEKEWYKILTGVYIYENKSYDFTEEQLANIQKVHDDKKITKELKEYIENFISNNL